MEGWILVMGFQSQLLTLDALRVLSRSQVKAGCVSMQLGMLETKMHTLLYLELPHESDT
jgi:hypothetical protein